MSKTAIILGSTGLTGSHLLDLLLKSDAYDRVISFVRKSSKISHLKLTEYVIDFDNPDSYKDLVKGDDLFCCLGTTINKAGSQEAFEKIDLHYPIRFAQMGKTNGVKQYLIITALGANSQSSNFYMRTKGKCEEELKKTAIPSVSVFRPSLLLGNRKEFRLGERLGAYAMRFLGLFMLGKLRKYRAVESNQVALAMFNVAQDNKTGFQVYESDLIQGF